MTRDEWKLISWFTKDEMKCKCECEEEVMNFIFMSKIDWLRKVLGFPLLVSSGYRCKRWDDLLGGYRNHLGHAIDILIYGDRAIQLLSLAIKDKNDFTGFGLQQEGFYKKRFIHLDDTSGPRRLWTY